MTHLLAALPIDNAPLWPWSKPGWGLIALGLTGLLLFALTVWTYVRVPTLTLRRAFALLVIRALALGMIFLALLGTSCVSWKAANRKAYIVIAVDASASMSNVRDVGKDNLSRWEHALNELRANKELMQRLSERHNVEVRLVKFGQTVELDFDPEQPGDADAMRTDYASVLAKVVGDYRNNDQVRALIIIGDGANNYRKSGTPPPSKLAEQWKNEHCLRVAKRIPGPIRVLALGNDQNQGRERDVVIYNFNPPSRVYVKGDLYLKANVKSGLFMNRNVRVRAFVNDKEIDPEEVIVGVEGEQADSEVVLRKQKSNVITLERENLIVNLRCIAPPTAGEIKVTLKVEDPVTGKPLDGELSANNNQISTFVDVTKEGISLLFVERQERFPEPQILLPVLARDERIRVYRVWIRGQAKLDVQQKDLFDFKRRPYDVIILGDVSATRLKEADPDLLQTLHDKVFNEGVGLLMLGGQHTFGNPDENKNSPNWNVPPFDKLMPVDLDTATGQRNGITRLVPTSAGMNYVMRLGGSAAANKAIWEGKLPGLDGYSHLGTPRADGKSEVFAAAADGTALLVGKDYGSGRVMAFAGDTTYRWRNGDIQTGLSAKEGREVHAKFWRQLVRWLAHQDEKKNDLVITPDTRRLPVDTDLYFSLQLFAKNGQLIDDAKYENVKLIDPNNKSHDARLISQRAGGGGDLPSLPGNNLYAFSPALNGEYLIEATGKGVDPETKETVEKTARMRIITFREDAEITQLSANHEFLKQIMIDGGGELLTVRDTKGNVVKGADGQPIKRLPVNGDLAQLLREHGELPPVTFREEEKTPDWRTSETPSPFFIGFFLIFVQLLALEWFLRRSWGLR